MTIPKHVFEFLKLFVVGLDEPFARLWVPVSLVSCLFFDLCYDTLHPVHVLNSLLCYLVKALVEQEHFTKILRFLILLSEQICVDAANFFCCNLLFQEFLYLLVFFFIECGDFLADIRGFIFVGFVQKAPVFKLNLLQVLLAADRLVRVLPGRLLL